MENIIWVVLLCAVLALLFAACTAVVSLFAGVLFVGIALGMLLMLRDKAKSSGKTVCLANARGSVRQVLDIANFGKLFPIV